MWSYNYTYSNDFYHHGIKGQRWGVRRFQNKDGSLTPAGKKKQKSSSSELAKALSPSARAAYAMWANMAPREAKYALRKLTNNPDTVHDLVSKYANEYTKKNGTLPTDATALKAVETMGIKRHKDTKYDNLTNDDIANFKTYTNSARYSRGINTYLATGEPKEFAAEADKLKKSLSKNRIDDCTVYRSCNYKFSTNGLAKKAENLSESELASMFDGFSKNYNGKKLKENRVYSTSTSPLFAVDTWRKVNPTAASTYNTYLVINCKGTPGILADGRTTSGKSLVNTHSNQEAILAPTKLQYRKLTFDKERNMFAITVDALGDD